VAPAGLNQRPDNLVFLAGYQNQWFWLITGMVRHNLPTITLYSLNYQTPQPLHQAGKRNEKVNKPI
jgi:hypothetical protein